MRTAISTLILCAQLGAGSLRAQSICSSADSQPFVNGHATVDLLARYDDLIKDDLFVSWVNTHGGTVARWSEELLTNKQRRIVIETSDDLHVISFDAILGKSGSTITTKPRLFDVTKANRSRAETLDDALRRKVDGQTVQVHPRVRGGRLTWEVDFLDQNKVSVFEMRRVLEPRGVLRFAKADAADTSAAAVDENLTSNDVHHVADFAIPIDAAAIQQLTAKQKAQRVHDFVRIKYAYKELSEEMEKFTFADHLVRFDPIPAEGVIGAGLCDELSVVVISYLRNLGVPARLRFLTANGGREAHAFAEFQDETGAWAPVDVVYNNVGDLDVYCSKMADVELMLAEKPDDTLSGDELCFGLPDNPGDHKFNPYCDFVLTPDYPGQSESRYSDCPQTKFMPLVVNARR